MIKVLIIDDEFLARKRLVDLLSSNSRFRVVEECKNGQEALASIKKHKPDVIFLDIQMPGLTGLEVLKKTSYEPIAIFVTAYEVHALEAFELRALDYLLKPFSNDRFRQTIGRIEEAVAMKHSVQLKQKLTELIKEDRSQPYIQVISLKAKGIWYNINLYDVGYVKTEGNYVRIYCKDCFYLHRVTIQELQDTLDPHIFMRIHRGIIINRLWVKNIKYLVQNFEYRFTLTDDTVLVSGRSYKGSVDEYLEKHPDHLFRN
jgi:two-component system, LytTR family, response regulator